MDAVLLGQPNDSTSCEPNENTVMRLRVRGFHGKRGRGLCGKCWCERKSVDEWLITGELPPPSRSHPAPLRSTSCQTATLSVFGSVVSTQFRPLHTNPIQANWWKPKSSLLLLTNKHLIIYRILHLEYCVGPSCHTLSLYDEFLWAEFSSSEKYSLKQ